MLALLGAPARAGAAAPDGFDWAGHIAAATRVVPTRPGRIAFAVVDERGRYRGGYLPRETFFSASVVKAMRAHMPNFSTGPVWGRTHVNALGVARLFWRIDRFVVPRHRAYARSLLAGVVPAQRWGVPRVAPAGWTPMFKGGFVGPPGARVVNQGVLLEKGTRRFALAVLTHDNPSQLAGEVTIERIAARLLRGYPATLPDLRRPTAPRTFGVRIAPGPSANLTWGGATDEHRIAAYRVFRNGRLVATVRGSVTRWHDPALAPGRSYRWFVRTVDGAGHASLPSRVARLSTPAA